MRTLSQVGGVLMDHELSLQGIFLVISDNYVKDLEELFREVIVKLLFKRKN